MDFFIEKELKDLNNNPKTLNRWMTRGVKKNQGK